MGNDTEIVYDTNENEVDPPVPLYKKALCGNHMFGDFFHLFWRNVDCHCCLFFRGVAVGLTIAAILKLVF